MTKEKYRFTLPQRKRLFLTDGGFETVMVFHEGLDLPCFAAIDLIRRPDGPNRIARYFDDYIAIAEQAGTGLIIETQTWRASPDWAEPIGFADLNELAEANRRMTELTLMIREQNESLRTPIVVSGCLGPRGDGYDPGKLMTVSEAANYHSWQIGILARSGVDMISALTMNNVEEAAGIALAAKKAAIPVALSFTVETDGRLPTGETLEEAIRQVDGLTNRYPAYYMINCAHPSHFAETLAGAGDWINRLRGVRANASKRSHAELDCACDLDAGDPVELGQEMAQLKSQLPHLTILGGCCGTDHRHIAEIAKAVSSDAQQAAE